MKQISQALGTACLQPKDDETAITYGVCQRIGFQTDQLANSIIGEGVSQFFHNTYCLYPYTDMQFNGEDEGNVSNSLEYFGLQQILPAPQPLGV